MFSRFFGSRRTDAPEAWALYEAAVARARAPVFYSDLGVPDTLDGRFESISLHVFLILHRLKADRPRTEALAQEVFDAMFSDMDRSLREMGAGDLGVAPRVKKMAKAFYGRVSAYDAALASDADSGLLAEALERNLYGTVDTPEAGRVAALAADVRANVAALGEQPLTALAAGHIAFAPLPAAELQDADSEVV